MSQIDFQLTRGIFYLSLDPSEISTQLQGHPLPAPPRALCDNISTDEITPGWVCFWHDATLGEYAMVGLRGGTIGRGALHNKFDVIVAGRSMGCGSSREHAPYAQKAAGVKLIIAESFAHIYQQNCHNIGLLTSTDFGLIPRLMRGETIPLEEFTRDLDPITQQVVKAGGLFQFNRQRCIRKMTLAEKIIARHAKQSSVKPGDALFCSTDVRFSHDYVTAMAAGLFYEGFGASARVSHPESVYAFRDHLTFLKDVMPAAQKQQGLLHAAENLAHVQSQFCETQGIRLYGQHENGGAEAICHNAILEDIASPGQLIIGTDSHTCTAGALGTFAFGVGTTDMANAWYTREIRLTVPASVRIQLNGTLAPNVTAKDIMLHLMSLPYFKTGQAIGQVLEFCGNGIASLNIDERATLTNMAVEAGALTGIIAADDIVVSYLRAMQRPIENINFEQSDADASYAFQLEIDLASLCPMVATPGDPCNGIALHTLTGRIPINIAYGGSCTGGKKSDMDMYARVLQQALARGQSIHADVEMYIQFGSQKIRAYAEERGYIDIFTQAGAKLINPACGACIKAGPGISQSPDQITVSAINRNFPGRSGPGQVYLASPLVVAASAVAGYIAHDINAD